MFRFSFTTAGFPNAIAPSGTSKSTIAPAAMRELLPILTFPSTLLFGIMATPSPSVGAPARFPVLTPPIVAPLYSMQFLPNRASELTTMSKGCISTTPRNLFKVHLNSIFFVCSPKTNSAKEAFYDIV